MINRVSLVFILFLPFLHSQLHQSSPPQHFLSLYHNHFSGFSWGLESKRQTENSSKRRESHFLCCTFNLRQLKGKISTCFITQKKKKKRYKANFTKLMRGHTHSLTPTSINTQLRVNSGSYGVLCVWRNVSERFQTCFGMEDKLDPQLWAGVSLPSTKPAA